MKRRLVTPPVFDDEDLNRRARLLNAMIWSSLTIAITLFLGLALSGSPVGVLIVVVAMVMVLITSLVWMRAGKVQQAALVFVFVGWAVIVLPAFIQDNLESPFVIFSIVMVLLASLLLDRRYVKIITGMSLAAITLMLINMYYPFAPQLVSSSSPLRRFATLLAIILVVSSIVQLAMSGLREALQTAEANGKRLADSNRLLAETQAVLEQRVSERTASLEARARQLQSAAEIAGVVASIRDLDVLLNEVAGMLSERFNYYHVGIFLLDNADRSLTLKAANSEAGRKLVGKGFSLAVEEQSMVAATARKRQSRVAPDVRMDDHYLELEELSLTRSEITLPLISGEKMLGVLDLQDALVHTPSTDELTTLRILANQIAVAIDNAQLLAASQKSLESLQRAYGSLSRDGWQKVMCTHQKLGYRAGLNGQSIPTSDEWRSEMTSAQLEARPVLADELTLAVPIRIRDQVAGVVRLLKPVEAGAWNSDEIALVETLSDRLSAALESARLYEETRRRAERERLTGEITARIRAANDPQAILQIAAQELRSALQADHANLVVRYDTDHTPLTKRSSVPANGGDTHEV